VPWSSGLPVSAPWSFDAQWDGEAAAVVGDLRQVGKATEAGLVGEGVVGVRNAPLVLRVKKAGRALAGDLADRIDEQDPA
jgi:hypothetical protein